jgi:hypothetical protein
MALKLGDRPIVIIKWGRTAEEGFNIINEKIDNIIINIIFSYYKLNLYKKNN